MTWLTRLDTRAAHWPTPARWGFLTIRWLLIALGAFLVVGLAREEIAAGRVGLGTGVAVAVVLACVKGVAMALTGSAPGASSAP